MDATLWQAVHNELSFKISVLLLCGGVVCSCRNYTAIELDRPYLVVKNSELFVIYLALPIDLQKDKWYQEHVSQPASELSYILQPHLMEHAQIVLMLI